MNVRTPLCASFLLIVLSAAGIACSSSEPEDKDSAGETGDSAGTSGTDNDPGWDYPDNRPASQDPPGGLPPSRVPMFVSIGSDDNLDADGVDFLASLQNRTNPVGKGQAATYDGTPVSITFYNTGMYKGLAGEAWKRAHDLGHEVGNHTETHRTAVDTTAEDWQWEIDTCEEKLVAVGIPLEQVFGFRAPFLATNDVMMTTLQKNGFWYDVSLEEGFQPDHDGTNFFWPYTLDSGSPGNDLLVGWGTKQPIESHPGLWELPLYALIAPPDDKAEDYGIEPGFRDRLKAIQDWFDVASGKLTGLDYNLIHEDTFGISGPEYAGTLMYSFDLRMAGNRAPFMLGAHAQHYSLDDEEYREAIDTFITHVLAQPDVRVVSIKQILDWLRAPVPL